MYLQIILIKIQENGGQMTNTYPLLDSGIQSKLFRQEYKWKLWARKMFNIPSQTPLVRKKMYEKFLHLQDIQDSLVCSSDVKDKAISKKILEKQKKLFQQYKETTGTWIIKDYAKKMSQDELKKTSNRIWFLPHHQVFHSH